MSSHPMDCRSRALGASAPSGFQTVSGTDFIKELRLVKRTLDMSQFGLEQNQSCVNPRFNICVLVNHNGFPQVGQCGSVGSLSSWGFLCSFSDSANICKPTRIIPLISPSVK